MKNYLFRLMLVLFSLTLVACGPKADQNSETTRDNLSATLKVTSASQKIEKKVSFKKGDTVMDILEANLKDVKEEGGMVTAIEGVSQDEQKSVFWMYKVNGKMAEVGAQDYKVKEDDKVEFYQDTYQ